MSILYKQIRDQVALRSNQLSDAASAADLEAAYVAATAFEGMEVPATAIKQAILAAEKRIAAVIGRCKNPVLRRSLYGRSADIANEAQMPATDNAAKEWLGAFSNVLDSVTNDPLTEVTKQEVVRLNRLFASGTLKIRPFHFAFGDTRLYHTRANAYVEGVSWDHTAQLAAYTAGSSPLPQEVEVFWIADTLAILPQENWFASEAGLYAQIAMKCERDILQGVIPQAVLPDSTANSDPVKN